MKEYLKYFRTKYFEAKLKILESIATAKEKQANISEKALQIKERIAFALETISDSIS